MKNILILLTFLIFGCGTYASKNSNNESPFSESKKENSKVSQSGSAILFHKINNKAKVFIDDSLIYESETILSGYEVDYRVDLDSILLHSAENIKIELYNGVEPYDEQIDQKWEIMYDLILKGEVVDFVNESIYDNKIGLAYKMKYKIEDWVID